MLEDLSESGLEDIVPLEENEDRDMIKLFLRMRDSTVRCQRAEWIFEYCKEFFNRDYVCKYMDKLDYVPVERPKFLIIPTAGKGPKEQVEKMEFDEIEYFNQGLNYNVISETRFPSPVLLFNGKYVCRSRYPAVLKGSPKKATSVNFQNPEPPRKEVNVTAIARMGRKMQRDNFAENDAHVLQSLKISSIYDLSSSKEHNFVEDIMQSESLKYIYQKFEISNMPYPGWEKFEKLAGSEEGVEETTKRCLKLFLQRLTEAGKGGILIQSFTGQHRTSFFISLIRLSLWADGVIHQSLELKEIAFLTLAYDWYRFGYRMNEIRDPEKEMLAFFFTFLPVISTDEFSITSICNDTQDDEALITGLKQVSSHRENLKELSKLFLENYRKSTLYLKSFK